MATEPSQVTPRIETLGEKVDRLAAKVTITQRVIKRLRVAVIALGVLATVLAGLVWFQYDNYNQDEADRLAAARVADQLTELCETGKIDCEGTRGLPGPKGTPGIGITRQRCDYATGRFEFTYTNGMTRQIGDCVAEDGARGPRGLRGPQGFRGEEGPRGPRGFRGQKGKPGGVFTGPPRITLPDLW